MNQSCVRKQPSRRGLVSRKPVLSFVACQSIGDFVAEDNILAGNPVRMDVLQTNTRRVNRTLPSVVGK